MKLSPKLRRSLSAASACAVGSAGGYATTAFHIADPGEACVFGLHLAMAAGRTLLPFFAGHGTEPGHPSPTVNPRATVNETDTSKTAHTTHPRRPEPSLRVRHGRQEQLRRAARRRSLLARKHDERGADHGAA
jgi:hypothetical protein